MLTIYVNSLELHQNRTVRSCIILYVLVHINKSQKRDGSLCREMQFVYKGAILNFSIENNHDLNDPGPVPGSPHDVKMATIFLDAFSCDFSM